MIAGLAATEVEGVELHGRKYHQRAGRKAGNEESQQGRKVEVSEEHVSVDLSLNMK